MFKQSDVPQSSDLKAFQAEMVKFKSELRQTTEERDILEKAAAHFTSSPAEVRLQAGKSARVSSHWHES